MTDTADIVSGLETLLSGISVGAPVPKTINDVYIHPVDMREQFGEWTIHVTLSGTIDDEDMYNHYDDLLSCRITLYGQSSEKNRNETSKQLWRFRDALIAAFEGQPGLDNLGPYCDNWSVTGEQEIVGMSNGTATWIALSMALRITRTVVYPV